MKTEERREVTWGDLTGIGRAFLNEGEQRTGVAAGKLIGVFSKDNDNKEITIIYEGSEKQIVLVMIFYL